MNPTASITCGLAPIRKGRNHHSCERPHSHQIMHEGRKVWLGLSHDVTEAHNAKGAFYRNPNEDIRLLASNLQAYGR